MPPRLFRARHHSGSLAGFSIISSLNTKEQSSFFENSRGKRFYTYPTSVQGTHSSYHLDSIISIASSRATVNQSNKQSMPSSRATVFHHPIVLVYVGSFVRSALFFRKSAIQNQHTGHPSVVHSSSSVVHQPSDVTFRRDGKTIPRHFELGMDKALERCEERRNRRASRTTDRRHVLTG